MSIYHYPSSTYNQALCGQWSQFTELKISKVSPTCKKCLKKLLATQLASERRTIMGREKQIGVSRLTKKDLELIIRALDKFVGYTLNTNEIILLGYKQRVEQIKEKIEQDPKWGGEAIQSQRKENNHG
jgi:hypothetical protein